MSIGISIFLLAAGAILYFAVSTTVGGVSISTVGVILMAVGALGLVLSLVMLQMARRPVDSEVKTTVVREDNPRI